MRAETLFRAIGEVDEAMLQDAVAAAAQPVKRRPPVRLLATAACAVLLAAAVLGAVAPVLAPKGGAGEMNTAGTQQDEMTSDAALPEFSLKEANGAGFGMEAVMVREESELVPTAWPVSSGETPASLPVYENARPADATGARAYTQEELSALAQQTAAALGFEVERVELSPTEAQRQATMERFEAAGLLPSEEDAPEAAAEKQAQLDYNLAPDSAAAVCTNGAVVTASRTGTVRVELAEGFDAAPYTQDAQAYAAAVQRLADEYGAAFGMQAPQAAVQADYTVEGNVHLTNFVWDAAASPAQQLLFASCGRLSFSAGESGAILYEQPQPGRALGEYALISESEARAMLLQGQCLTSVPYAVESEADIAAVELCYREGSEVYAPWYRFWVKLPEEAQQNCAPGCTVYGAYYVPAVRGEYIAGAPAA
ncbi:MAG: hypothetical protein U0N53_06425 [Ruthenibacterium sp.]|nr:hypothetical protein [Ruthenibacterium sp.]